LAEKEFRLIIVELGLFISKFSRNFCNLVTNISRKRSEFCEKKSENFRVLSMYVQKSMEIYYTSFLAKKVSAPISTEKAVVFYMYFTPRKHEITTHFGFFLPYTDRVPFELLDSAAPL
jgi:hypothetical protein